MKVKNIARIGLLFVLGFSVFAFAADRRGIDPAPLAYAQVQSSQPHCQPIGGTVMTNFGVIDQNTTLGTVTGDLRGAVSGTLLGPPQPGPGNTFVFHIQHHWVTEDGDTLFFDPATAITAPLSQNVFAIISLPVHLTGGTGKFAGATGDFTNIGEVDLTSGTVFRYRGQVCFAAQSQD